MGVKIFIGLQGKAACCAGGSLHDCCARDSGARCPPPGNAMIEAPTPCKQNSSKWWTRPLFPQPQGKGRRDGENLET